MNEHPRAHLPQHIQGKEKALHSPNIFVANVIQRGCVIRVPVTVQVERRQKGGLDALLSRPIFTMETVVRWPR